MVYLELVNIKNGKFHDKLATKISMKIDTIQQIKFQILFKTIKVTDSKRDYERVQHFTFSVNKQNVLRMAEWRFKH